MGNGRVLVVDGMSVLKTTAGGMTFLTNGFAYNFFSQLSATIKKFPDVKGIVVAWEGGHDHRTALFPGYKASRKPSTADVRTSREMTQKILGLLGVAQVHADGYEGDDMGAWLVHNLNAPCLLYSNDRDWLQLVGPGVSIYQKAPLSQGKKNARIEITREKFEHYTGWPSPEMYLKAKCIAGDKDEVPGLQGVAEVTARAFLLGQELGPKVKQKIEDFVSSADFTLNMKLADLRTPQPEIQPIWAPTVTSDVGKEALRTYLEENEWKKVLSDYDNWWDLYNTRRL